MNERNDFDDLARRKLDERAFAFDEAAWRDVERSLANKRNERGTWIWWSLSGAALLLIGLLVWWSNTDSTITPVAQVPEERSLDQQRTASEEANTPKASVAEPSATITAEAVPDATAPLEPEPVAPVRASINPTRRDQGTEPTVGEPRPAHVPDEPVSPVVPEPTPVAPMVAASASASDPVSDVIDVVEPSSEPAVSSDPVGGQASEPPSSSADVHVVQPIVGDSSASAGNASAVVDENGAPSVATQDGASAAQNDLATTTDSTASASVNDSTGTPPPATPPAAALIAPQSPWEISALGGMLLGSSNYSGGSSGLWKDDVRPLWTPGFGAEVMHMGRNWGIGTGLHYGTYAEHLSIAERTATETTTRDTSYFNQVQLMVLVVVDVIQIGNQTYYVTEQQDTTINVLVTGTTSTTSTRVLALARDQVNRVSYFEIPVLFDAHLVQGPWALGLRAGPTIGLLSGRRGAVPNNTLDGYTEFSDQQFQEVVFGYTARAYIRYRFSDLWSVGLEPAVRGQLVNGLNGGDLSRRASAFGGMFSVSYRLR